MRSATLASIAVALTLLGAGCGGESTSDVAEATVVRIADGDTLVLADGRHVRLVQIDAPEEDEGECYASDATEALERLAPPGSSITLEADPALDDVDRFGRLLRYVVYEGRNVNLELVRTGATAPWFFEGDRGRYADDLLEAAEAAREGRRGLWRACPSARLDPSQALRSGG